MATTIGATNPLRYRGYYYDEETGFYYLQSRYYDPITGRFLNADVLLSTGQGVLGYNMFAYCINDPADKKDTQGTVGIDVQLDGVDDPNDDLWTNASGGYSVDFSIAQNSSLYNGGVYSNGYMASSAPVAIHPCFIAGTLVHSEVGNVPIESILAGDLVWAWNEETGEVALKEVVETYINETDELIHVFVNGEEIVTTPAHPFYSPIKGWTAACKLRAGDILLTVNGKYVIVERVQHKILETPITVYNFQVKDNHTYYITGTGILVHNTCTGRDQLKKNMLSEGPAPGNNYQAHHGLPWKNRDYFNRAGLNVNDAKFGRWVIGGGNGGHQSWSSKYGALWDNYIRRHPVPDAADIIDYFNKLNGLK